MSEPCTWCGVDVDDDEGFRLSAPQQHERAVFCRLEHIVPWELKGARWMDAAPSEDDEGMALGVCAHCGAALGPDRVLLVRHRAQHRIGDGFCGIDHLAAWARRGGRWQTRS